MAHSNKPQPDSDVCDGAYYQDCVAAAEMSSEQLYWEEVLYTEGAKQDRYDGFDRGDLDYPYHWEEEEADPAEATTVTPPPPAPAPRVLEDDDILF